MRWGRFLMTALAAAALSACAEQPTRSMHEASMQGELRMASHWQALAADTARQTAETFSGMGDPNATFFVEAQDPGMPFAPVFERALVSELVRQDVPVSLTRDNSYRIHYSVDAVEHERWFNPPPTGTVIALAAGVWALDYFATQTGEDFDSALTAVGAFEFAQAMKVFGNLSEVVITVSVMDGDRLMARADSTYYVEGAEIAQFIASRPAPPLVQHRPAWADQPMAVREFRVTAD